MTLFPCKGLNLLLMLMGCSKVVKPACKVIANVTFLAKIGHFFVPLPPLLGIYLHGATSGAIM